ncbi:MAG: Mrp/NBP35 family ATP-binding protein [Candidatus Handelsmanbacteria bacterium]|nr:Mrp/NBP35 family ATP-binding protein [Candidatus Handelsmanbacteria bacterium]
MSSTPRTLAGGELLPGVRNAIAVTSAKGGVGKSTVAVNLALSLAARGAQVGLLDADIYGPSLPLLLGTRQEPTLAPSGKLRPVAKEGLALMSIGFVAGEQAPVIWRGPLLGQAVQQFLSQVEWGELDYLLLDLPPGTGDIPLTLSQSVELSGAVVVTTPQEVALQDVERGIAMFRKVEVETLGLIENMSYYLCPHCQARHEIFGHGGGRQAAQALGIEFFGELPLEAAIRAAGDQGRPIALAAPDSGAGRAFAQIAAMLEAAVERLAASL